MNWAAAVVDCVSDIADVTDVTTEDLPLCSLVAQLGANRYLTMPISVGVHQDRQLACC